MPSWIIWLLPAFPLAGFLINALAVRNGRTAGLVASASVGAAFVVAIAATVMLAGLPEEARRFGFVLWEWIRIGGFVVPFGLMIDPLSAVMALLITGVGGLIHIYSIGYMAHDNRPVRYFAALNLFVFSMLMLVLADNLLLMFLGWEGVGLCSFLLIGHYFERKSVPPGIVPAEASIKAFVVNRIGDAGLLLAMMLIVSRVGTLTFYGDTGSATPGFLARLPELTGAQIAIGELGNLNVGLAVGLLILLGVAGKSAQIPLFTWLPDAMAGPTPVSALIHAATMVTAGVYLMARTHTLFEVSDAAAWATGIGVATALVGALAAVTQFDIKRMLAYSTISQLGFMVAAVGMGGFVAGMFHLLTHGLFKALLFLAAGAIIHGTHETQDMRKMGGLRAALPMTFRLWAVGALAISGIFPLAGFWSKDEILGHAWFEAQNVGAALALVFASAITAFYMGRASALIFAGKRRDTSYEPHDPEPSMRWPMVILAAGAVIGGLLNIPGLHWLSTWLEPVLNEPEVVFTTERIIGQVVLALVATGLSAGMAYLGWWLYARKLPQLITVGKEDPAHYYLGDLWQGAEIGWGFDYVYTNYIARSYRGTARFLSQVVDRGAIDGVLVGGTARLLSGISRGLRAAQNGYVRNYALIFLGGVILLILGIAMRGV